MRRHAKFTTISERTQQLFWNLRPLREVRSRFASVSCGLRVNNLVAASARTKLMRPTRKCVGLDQMYDGQVGPPASPNAPTGICQFSTMTGMVNSLDIAIFNQYGSTSDGTPWSACSSTVMVLWIVTPNSRS